MEKPVTGIIGAGMIGVTAAVLCTMHGIKTICYWNGVDITEYQKKVNAPYWGFINWQFPTEALK